MKRIVVILSLLIVVFSFAGCYSSGVVVRSRPVRYHAPRVYYARPYYGGVHYYGYGYNRW
jgi:hypothetical protein